MEGARLICAPAHAAKPTARLDRFISSAGNFRLVAENIANLKKHTHKPDGQICPSGDLLDRLPAPPPATFSGNCFTGFLSLSGFR
jgi:hypothetical protein